MEGNGSAGSERGAMLNYEGMVLVWKALGIVPVIAAGNSGPNCMTVTSPSDFAAASAFLARMPVL